MVQMEDLVSLCKRRGFVFQSSEIYGGINGFWDYGPIGVELRRRVKDSWWKHMVSNRSNVVGVDTTIVAHPQTWVASGHVGSFSDPMIDCKKCKKRSRADHIVDNKCPSCGASDFTEGRAFNLMFKTQLGAVDDLEKRSLFVVKTDVGWLLDRHRLRYFGGLSGFRDIGHFCAFSIFEFWVNILGDLIITF